MEQRVVLAAALAVLGCSADGRVETPPIFRAVEKVVYGRAHPGDPGVVFVAHPKGTCSGVLIAPRVALTSKHCVYSSGLGELWIGVGPNFRTEGTRVAGVAEVLTPAGNKQRAGVDDLAALVLDADAALVEADGTRRPIPTFDWVREDPGVAAGTTLRFIGYGFTAASEPESVGTKRIAEARLEATTLRTFTTGELVCYGDSGGPAFLPDGRVWGLASEVIDEPAWITADCVGDQSLFTRTDAHRGLIEQALAAAREADPGARCRELGGRGGSACRGSVRVWCDPFGVPREQDCAALGAGTGCEVEACGFGARCCPAAGAPRPAEPECGAARDRGLLCDSDGLLVYCDSDGRIALSDCALGAPVGTECASSCTDGEGPWCCTPTSEECGGKRKEPIGCGPSGTDIRVCNPEGVVEVHACDEWLAGSRCAVDVCGSGPRCCPETPTTGPAPPAPPDDACAGRTNTVLGCGGADGETLSLCDDGGSRVDYDCPSAVSGGVCATDLCQSGAWCCAVGGAPGGDALCSDACRWAHDGECDDGGDGAAYSVCAYGTDCADCGARPRCTDACSWASDGMCDDGGEGSSTALCPLGTDCADCGVRGP